MCDWLKSEIQSWRHRSSYAIVRGKPLLLWESMSCGVGTKIVISDCICDSWLMRRVNNQLRKRLHMTSYTKQGENGGGNGISISFLKSIYRYFFHPHQALRMSYWTSTLSFLLLSIAKPASLNHRLWVLRLFCNIQSAQLSYVNLYSRKMVDVSRRPGHNRRDQSAEEHLSNSTHLVLRILNNCGRREIHYTPPLLSRQWEGN